MHTVVLRSDHQRDLVKQYVDKAPEDYVVKFSPPTRSLEQNNLMWELLTRVSRAKPGGRHHTPEIWKSLFMQACGHEVQFETGLNGQPFPIGFRTSKLTKQQMAELITFIEWWCSENGVNIG